ncbi:MAG: signal recognition particle-docking protein FtsY [Candidatus Fischerbacteria bacterium RBG_13_37_8]|uniref:Signal recognition particle receptor FtsY n=1 Tax=Candidatus Fischerbacteria bacterium RBG_13_37_8 TaxID=1817863 RepID=A0A1F5VQ93_9BACT|nr:MAG: signal recognition particle-docking protein FtsY [Candidatus Fischerbacteria bacterium RBG_13_37_8]
MFKSSLDRALQKAKSTIFSRLNNYFTSAKTIDQSFWDDLEECLIESDVSYQLSQNLLSALKNNVKAKKINSTETIKDELKNILVSEFESSAQKAPKQLPFVIILLGVNGVGKTTAAAKLAYYYYNKHNIESLFCAGDTFRAAAIDQLAIWADKLQCDVVKHKEGSDPSAVLYDSIQAANARSKELIIVDTAGRLHTKKNLMAELEKMMRIAKREVTADKIEVFLVLDATIGQNGLMQAKIFSQHLPIDGIIITKLDGTAKGGIALSIVKELNIPIKFVSTGETLEDFEEFSSQAYCDALLNQT